MDNFNFIIPMCGLSSRFKNEGYQLPKYMLEAKGKTLFEHSVDSFKRYFEDSKFLIIVLNIDGVFEFLAEKLKKVGIKNFEIIVLENPTRGQAETVAIGLKKSTIVIEGGIIVFNIDTFRPGYIFPEHINTCDGYIEVFEGEGDNWSYAQPLNEQSTAVIRTAEKKRISKLCSTGLYYFINKLIFLEAFDKLNFDGHENNKELYVAPMYNYLISKNYRIHYNLINKSEVVFCGIPSEYEIFISN